MPRPDRMTMEGMVYNANQILDRFEYVVEHASGEEVSLASSPREDISTAGPTGGVEDNADADNNPKNATEELSSTLPQSSPSLPAEESSADHLQGLPIPCPDYLQGVLLLTVVLPPISDYVGRVGTGLAYFSRNHNRSDDSEGTLERDTSRSVLVWSEPQPCSLTALAPPIPNQREIEAFDVIFFVCSEEAVRDDWPKSGNWWTQLFHPRGLLGAERVQRPEATKQENQSDTANDDDDVDTDDADENDNQNDAPTRSTSAVNDPTTYVLRNLAHLSYEQGIDYPFEKPKTALNSTTTTSTRPTLFYYAWEKDNQLLADEQFSLERIMLMELNPLPPSSETTTVDETSADEGRLRKRLQELWQPAQSSLVDDNEDASSREEPPNAPQPLALDPAVGETTDQPAMSQMLDASKDANVVVVTPAPAIAGLTAPVANDVAAPATTPETTGMESNNVAVALEEEAIVHSASNEDATKMQDIVQESSAPEAEDFPKRTNDDSSTLAQGPDPGATGPM